MTRKEEKYKKFQKKHPSKLSLKTILIITIVMLITLGCSTPIIYFKGVSDCPLDHPTKNPTSAEMWGFLEDDKTSEKDYTEEYICAEFARDVKRNANDKGIRCAFVILEFGGVTYAHTIVAFETTDSGLVYIDSTDGPDFQVYPQLGEVYFLQGEDVLTIKIVEIW